jgi:hypothetical protein
MDNHFFLFNSSKPTKKYMVKYVNPKTGNINTIHFGLRNAQQYPIHKDKNKKNLYLKRHGNMGEDWSKNGIYTAGFWSRWLLWNLPNLDDSIKDIEKRFGITIYNKID